MSNRLYAIKLSESTSDIARNNDRIEHFHSVLVSASRTTCTFVLVMTGRIMVLASLVLSSSAPPPLSEPLL